MTPACGVDGCRIHARHTHGPEAIAELLPLDASDPWLRVGMGGRLPGPSQASLGSPDWVASFAVRHPMAYRPMPSLAAVFTEATSSMPGCSGLDALLAPGRALDREQARLAKDEADDDTAARRMTFLLTELAEP